MLEKKMAKVDVCENYVSGQPGMAGATFTHTCQGAWGGRAAA